MQRSFYFIGIGALAVILLARIFLYFHFHKEQTLPKNQPIRFEATVKNEPKFNDRGQILKIADSRVYVDFYPRYRVGDRLHLEGEVNDDGRMFGAKIAKIGENTSLSAFRSKLREVISANIASILPAREATLVSGMILGVDSISGDFKEELTGTGTIHVVVVSGQNLAIVAGFFAASARFVGRRKSWILTLLAVSAYAFLAGFEPPVVRAALMVLSATMATFFGREIRPLWGLLMAACAILLIWPAAILEVSFQLTFAATLGIITLGRVLGRAFSKIPIIGENAAVATSAYLFTLPIIIYYFGQASIVAPFANIAVAELVAPIMMLGFILAVAALIFLPLAQLLAYFAFVPAFAFVKIVQVFAGMGVGQISFGRGNWVIAATIYSAVFVLLWIFANGPRKRPDL